MTRPEEAHKTQLRSNYIDSCIKPATPDVLSAFEHVDRMGFVPEQFMVDATRVYSDAIIALWPGSSMSQPSLIALCLGLLEIQQGARVLEIGTASGFTAALLGELVGPEGHVDTTEIIPQAVTHARAALAQHGSTNVSVYQAHEDVLGVPFEQQIPKEQYDAMILTAGLHAIPETLIAQLKVGGRIVMPVGKSLNRLDLLVGIKQADGSLQITEHGIVRFVETTGTAPGGWAETRQHQQDILTHLLNATKLPAEIADRLRRGLDFTWPEYIQMIFEENGNTQEGLFQALASWAREDPTTFTDGKTLQSVLINIDDTIDLLHRGARLEVDVAIHEQQSLVFAADFRKLTQPMREQIPTLEQKTIKYDCAENGLHSRHVIYYLPPDIHSLLALDERTAENISVETEPTSNITPLSNALPLLLEAIRFTLDSILKNRLLFYTYDMINPKIGHAVLKELALLNQKPRRHNLQSS